MTPTELRVFRGRAKLTQIQMAELLGMSVRSYQTLEAHREGALGRAAELALDGLSLRLACERADPLLLTPRVVRAVIKVEGLITPHQLAALDFGDVVIPSSEEYEHIRAFEATLSRPLTREETKRYLAEVRFAEVERSSGQIRLP